MGPRLRGDDNRYFLTHMIRTTASRGLPAVAEAGAT